MTDQFKQKGSLYKWSWRQKLGVAVAILGPLTVVGYQAVTWLSGDTWPPLCLLILRQQQWLPELLQGKWFFDDRSSHIWGYSVIRWLMDLPLSVLLCGIGFCIFIWDEDSAVSDGRPVT